jgi:hypothetical protein
MSASATCPPMALLWPPMACVECAPRPRAVKRKMSNYAVKRTVHRSWPQPTRPPAGAVRVLAAP